MTSRRVLNVGGNSREIPLPPEYDGWQNILLDIDPRCNPDVLCDTRDLGQLPAGSFESVYCSHNLEHYYHHDVAKVLAGFQHVLKEQGFVFIRVPDMAALMRTVVERQLDIGEVLYQSSVGPITVRDVIYGYGLEIERSGNDFFAHKTGFTESALVAALHAAGFSHVFITDGFFEIATFAFKNEPDKEYFEVLNLGAMRASRKLRIDQYTASTEVVPATGEEPSVPSEGSPLEVINKWQAPIVLTTVDGLAISVSGSLASISTYVLLEQERWFEKEGDFLASWLKPGMNAIDIGANVGVYSLPIARTIGVGGRVFAFEPGAGARALLEASRVGNGLDNLQVLSCALADEEKQGWLQEGASSELNSLSDDRQSTGESSLVHVSTLDIQEGECRWPPIDFVKIDAEGQEERIVAGGKSFFARHSPLVMYEIRHGGGKTGATRWVLEAIGLRSYRLLGDASCLVPVASDEQFDPYELNLFAAKPDRAAHLAQLDLLCDKFVAHALTDSERAQALRGLLAQDYVRAFEFSVDDIAQCPFGDALVAYAAYRYAGLSCGRRYAALLAAFELLNEYCAKEPTPASLASLVRVALDLGQRHVATDALGTLVGASGVEIDQPFYPPCARYENISPLDRESAWFVAAANEQFELARSHSSCFQSGDLDRLKWLCDSPFSSPEINRRLILEAVRRGQELPELLTYVDPAHRHQNPVYWTVAGFPMLSRMR